MQGLYSVDSCLQVTSCPFCHVYQVVPDVKVVSNLPALSMEETIPLAVSDATLLAPQEVEVGHRCLNIRYLSLLGGMLLTSCEMACGMVYNFCRVCLSVCPSVKQ